MIPSFGDATAAARRIQTADYPHSFGRWSAASIADADLLAAFVLAGQDTERLRRLRARVVRALAQEAGKGSKPGTRGRLSESELFATFKEAARLWALGSEGGV